MAEQSLFQLFPMSLMSCFNALRPVPMQIDPGGVAKQWLCPRCSFPVSAVLEAFVFKLMALPPDAFLPAGPSGPPLMAKAHPYASPIS